MAAWARRIPSRFRNALRKATLSRLDSGRLNSCGRQANHVSAEASFSEGRQTMRTVVMTL